MYIAVGVAASVAVLIATAFSLFVLVPALSQVTVGIDDSLDNRVLNAINFSKYDTNTTYVRCDVQTYHYDSHFRFRFAVHAAMYSTTHQSTSADVQQFPLLL